MKAYKIWSSCLIYLYIHDDAQHTEKTVEEITVLCLIKVGHGLINGEVAGLINGLRQ